MTVDIKEFLKKPRPEQCRWITIRLGRLNQCMIYTAAVRNNTTQHVPELRQLRHLVAVETAIDYHNRSEVVTERIMARPDAASVWGEIYRQYIPAIAAQATAGDVTGAWSAIMAMLAKVESQY
jgi:hypothetical protein